MTKRGDYTFITVIRSKHLFVLITSEIRVMLVPTNMFYCSFECDASFVGLFCHLCFGFVCHSV